MTLRVMAASAARVITAIAIGSRCVYATPPKTAASPNVAKSHFLRILRPPICTALRHEVYVYLRLPVWNSIRKILLCPARYRTK